MGANAGGKHGNPALPEEIHVVTVCDREEDMYKLFDEEDSKRQAFLIRIVQNRKTAENEKILDAIRAKPCMGRVKTALKGGELNPKRLKNKLRNDSKFMRYIHSKNQRLTNGNCFAALRRLSYLEQLKKL